MRRLLPWAVVLAFALAGCGGSDTGLAPAAPPSPDATELDSGPVGVADVDGEAWTVLTDAGEVRTADDRRVAVGDAPLRIVSTPGGVWVSVIRDGTVVRIDPETLQVDATVALRPAGSEPEGLAWDGTHLWVVDQAGGRVVELDPSGKVVGSYTTDDEPRLVAAGDSGIWVANYGGTSVSRIADGRVRTVPLTSCVGPQGIAEVAGRVWVSCTLSGKAVSLDARTMKQVAEVPNLPDADAVVANGSTVYVVGQSGPTVYVLDAASGRLRDTVRLGDAMPTSENVGAALVDDELVVTHPDEQKIYSLPPP
ncbi:Vgb family protein [Nocardioides sp. HB32]